MPGFRHAGCNGHVSKPISKQRLLNVIEEYGLRTNPPDRPETEAPEPITPRLIKIDMPPRLEAGAVLISLTDAERYHLLLRAFPRWSGARNEPSQRGQRYFRLRVRKIMIRSNRSRRPMLSPPDPHLGHLGSLPDSALAFMVAPPQDSSIAC